MRATFIVKYETNDQIPYHQISHLKPTDYHRVPDHSYKIQYDQNNVMIDLGHSRVSGTTALIVYERLFPNKPIIAQYGTDSFAGGRFVIYADHMAELTTYGSGVPIIGSEVGIILDE